MNVYKWDDMTDDQQKVEFDKLKQAERDRYHKGKIPHISQSKIRRLAKKLFTPENIFKIP